MKYLLILLIFLPGERIGMTNPRSVIHPTYSGKPFVYRNHSRSEIIYLNLDHGK